MPAAAEKGKAPPASLTGGKILDVLSFSLIFQSVMGRLPIKLAAAWKK